MVHEKGNENCTACRKGFPVRCDCGGLVHADPGCILVAICDQACGRDSKIEQAATAVDAIMGGTEGGGVIARIKRLKERVRNQHSCMGFLGKAEPEIMVASTIRACCFNYEDYGIPFSFKGDNLKAETRMAQNASSYATLLHDDYLREVTIPVHGVVIVPTAKLLGKLEVYFGIK